MKIYYKAIRKLPSLRKTSAEIEIHDDATEIEIQAAIRQDFLNGHKFEYKALA